MEPLFGGGDALLQLPHLGGQGGLVAHGGGQPPQEGRDLGAGLGEAEDVVDEEEQVAPLLVPEVLRHRQPGQAHPQARPRGLVHLPEDQHGVLEDVRFLELVVEVVPLAGCARPRRRRRSSPRTAGRRC